MIYLKRLVAGIFILLINSCLFAQADGFTINGVFKGDYSGYIYLKYENAKNIKVKDSTLVENGKFYFQGQVNTYFPRASLRLSSTSLRCDEPNSICFPVENSTIEVSLTYRDFQHIAVKGVVTADTIARYLGNQKKLDSSIASAEQETSKTTNKKRQEELEEKIRKLKKSKLDEDTKYIKKLPGSSLSPYLILVNEEQLSAENLNRLYYHLTPRQQSGYYGLKVMEIVDRNDKISNQVGSKAPLFVTRDINNKELRLQDIYKDKVVLLDFWASWCIPCRQSHPKLKKIYSKFHDKGFEIIGIASNTENEFKWREAVTKDSLSWLQILQTENGASILNNPTDINEKYHVTIIPVKIVIDRNGKIIGRFTNDEEVEMEVFLKKLFITK